MNGLHTSIIGRAMEKGLLSIDATDIRDFAENKHNRVDDYPYGGGAGMVMQPGPVYRAFQTVTKDCEEELIFLCGHYEGIDERVLEMIVTDPVSIGDYVLTGGELPAMVMIDTISRLVPGVLNNEESAGQESHQGHLLEYPQYTRPDVFEGREVPAVLLSGHHKNIETWRRQQSLLRTRAMRPDMFAQVELTKADRKFLDSLTDEQGE